METKNVSEELILAPRTTHHQSAAEFTLSWSDVVVETRSPKKSKFSTTVSRLMGKKNNQEKKSSVILDNLAGIVRSGEILAIMGTSGIGKTTLMNILSGRFDTDTLHAVGNVYLNGFLTTDSQRRKDGIIGYVEQNEYFIETLTLKEHLIFQAMLGIRDGSSDDERRARVVNVISQFHLTKCMGTLIRNLSGGEKKRLAVAAVCLLNPEVILIDEPTTGLDAYLALDIMKTIHLMTMKSRRAIIVVIHQPSSAMFDLIDNICILVYGGKQAFFGRKNDALQFFNNECKLSYPFLDDYIEELAKQSSGNGTDSTTMQQKVSEKYADSEYARWINMAVQESMESRQPMDTTQVNRNSRSNQFTRQAKWLLWRSFIGNLKDPIRTTFVFFRTFVPSLMFGLIYFHLCGSGSFVQNVNALDQAIISFVLSTSFYVILSTSPLSHRLALKESDRGLYSISPYFFSTILQDLPAFIICPIIINTVLYYMSGMDNTWSHYFEFCAIGILASIVGASIGHLFASFSKTVDSAVGTAVPIFQIMSMFSGFFVNFTHTSKVLGSVQYLSPFYHYYSSLLTLQWNRRTYNYTQECIHDGEKLISNTESTSNVPSSLYDLCSRVLLHINFQEMLENLGLNISMLFIWSIVGYTGAFIILWLRAHRTETIIHWPRLTKKARAEYQPIN